MKHSIHLQLDFNLKALRLPTILKNYQRLSQEALKQQVTLEQYLYQLSDLARLYRVRGLPDFHL